ncbi:MAG TPA: UDP-N-acetylmuramoyl-L-alanine--D-glutamate ligase [Candidatus Saccharimonadales bacterium]|nr:UDP-N-acetylmuramoyl-L-alanine--D-glutamate ligase [Candidatus Saccharimonadales bacterium]
MKIAILGYGAQGRAAYEYWRVGNEITVCDGNEQVELPAGAARRLGPDHLKDLDGFDLIVRSPIVHPRDVVAANSPAILDKVTTVTNEFFRVCPSKHIIGVTGTKGKGTTSTLIANMLAADGRRVHLGGNIGIPPLDMLKDDIRPEDWVVLELANFQLIDLSYSPPVGVCLMVVAEHLDWHADEAEYVAAKSRLFERQTSDDVAIYFAENDTSRQIAAHGAGRKIPYFAPPGATAANGVIVIDGQRICSTDELKLLGKHNWQNVCAAVTAVWQVTQNIEAMRTVLTSFSGLEHRLELVRELDGVRYYDDSFGTAPETAVVAIQAFSQPKVVILGGSDKGADYGQLARVIAESNIRKILLIGEQAARIGTALAAAGVDSGLVMPGGHNINEIAAAARAAAQPGDVVLLSPACASFDMFKNYKDRGEQFKKAVNSL